jgi:hypothetical protein
LESGEPLELCMTANQIETLRAWREEPPETQAPSPTPPEEGTDPVDPIDPVDEEPTMEEQAAGDPPVPESDITVSKFATAQEAREKVAKVGMMDLREPEKFATLRTYIDSTLSVPSVEAQIGKLAAAGMLTDRNLWETKDPWHVAATALARVKDPVWLAGYWPSICFLRGKTLGNPRNEAQIAMSIAVIETVGEMIGA